MRRILHPQTTNEVIAVVVTYNGAAWIQDCLQSLADSYHPVTAIVVDNGSTDDTLALVGAFPDVTSLPQGANLGFGRANNIGIRVALERKARWVFLLNQDARVEPETIGELVRVSVAHPRFGILSPFHLDGKGANLDPGFVKHLYRAETGLLSDLYLGQNREAYSTAMVNAAAWLLTGECLQTVGGFDPLFFMYGEDDDYCNRVRWHGLDIGIVPSAVVFHDRPSERLTQNRQGSTLESIVAWRVSHMLYDLKQPRESYFWRIGSWGLTSLRTGLVLLASGQFKDLLAWIIGLLKVVIYMPRVWKHRKMERMPGKHWI